MYKIEMSAKFRKDLKLAIKRRRNIPALDEIVEMLAAGKELPKRNKDHALEGDMSGFRECHIAPDWLLVYRIWEDILVLSLTRTGSHSDLF